MSPEQQIRMSRRQTSASHPVVVNTVRRELTLLLLKVVMLGINSLKMFAAVLLMTGTTVAFNIYNVPVHHFTSDDPLFGQSLVQSSDGVYVLSPTNGEVKCKLGNNCSKLNIPVSGKKGLRPVASAASKWNKEKILVCNQVRTKVGSTENLNGNCTLLSGEKKEDINPASLDEININKTTFEGTCHEPLKQDSTNINNNNNNYHGNPTGYQVHQRMRREVEKNDKETDEDEDAGTEIAFVLDGSGSIEAEDFEKCNFAIVQYGSKIRTELSLLENDNRTEALNKVKNIKQTYNLTKTASALYHVLTEVFVPESGSKKDAKKMIILLSDGRILGDNRSLPDVLNMTEMKDILRFAIGIGPDVVNNPIAVKEMIQIAGDENRYFSLSSYAALENILSPLEQRIIGIKDAGTEIAFVLDGSGSIEEEDFEKAKNFIYNVMKNVWTSCFSCNFAIVQYGSEIRTELSLLENDDGTEALNKVKSIKQTYNLTKTASALHHVLTEVFVPESGSKKDAKKMIILLSDGRILGDNRSLPDVLNMTEMKDILRFSIGIGPDVVNNPIAVKEMIQIAGDENRYFSLSSYAALENILSPLEQRIIGIKDAGTEIAFVLDGSGSIEEEDFEKAKNFIYNVMKNVWTSCFSCNFAIVQYGSEIRTELSLLENDNRTEALNKVKSIKQTYNLTKTASALHHVLTEVFVPESGSKKDAKKMIILLSDGRILGDNRSLPDVLNMTEMKDILRFSIGIGPDVVNNPIAVKEMIQIAGDENRYFSLSSYAALENILSPLEQRIIGIKDAGTEIAFVLDGSGSIEEEDFEKAKNFIYNVMKNVWTSCFSCNFAIVQYGSEIRTELSLLENDNRTEALNKVKSIKQTYNLTKTASALHHVLTEVFVPESGSKKDTKKMIILLSDGRILGDNRSLPDVLNMTEMKDILRFAIGIGPDVVNNPIAVKEMIQIAGDENRYFSLSSYAALENILSPLEQRIIGIKDAGTEIAFVLDGSGSIEEEDFEKAKDFIYNVMKNVWTSCFSCNFAIVQYGSEIRTELSLLENDDGTEALNKVKSIKQTYNLTKTASALHHVLTEVFVLESGSKKDAKKMIILLSDGRILGDNRSLPDVLNMTEMKDILRFAIGIGPDVVNNPIAVKEMIQIAGDENRYFSLSSYAALENILSPLEQRIIGIKG
ncbi:collagen alpha-6(VI) chain-like isoform X2 [Brachyhypopomus gauderio]|uniref:collagen alpha-6(VI) chain-like isoform X2 n=1 Tax=Brachyhypopomus gauderio TaxID=698409 RepID=UPI00404295F6